MRVLLIVLSFLLVLLSCNDNPVDDGPETDTMTDIEGNIYNTVKIGDQWWMAENLRVTQYNDGTPIPHITDEDEWLACTSGAEAYCIYLNQTEEDFIKKAGALYNWYVVNPENPKRIAPAGWHIPTDAEWTVMEKYLVLNGYNYDGTTDTSEDNKIAKSLADKLHWEAHDRVGSPGNKPEKNNKSGFTALSAGHRFYDLFTGMGKYGYWWSSTEVDSADAYIRGLSFGGRDLSRNRILKFSGSSVRLVKD